VSARKGEYQHLLNELNAQGFVRARIDGEIHELDDPPQLDARKKHDIEVVVDRFRVRPDLQLRLAESIETALKLSGGILRVASMDDEQAEPETFSANFACPVCSWSLAELEPRLFSFNNPAGACPTCDGLGVEQFFDPAKVVAQPQLSLAEGAIRGWDRRNGYYHQMLKSLAAHYGFELDTPWQALEPFARELVLNGSGEDKLKLKLPHERGSGKQRTFEGVLGNMQRRYRETDSSTVREELARFISTRPCPDCGGARLNAAARHVLVAGRNLGAVSALPVGESLAWFES
jgi:excinuclease ABC subunit A